MELLKLSKFKLQFRALIADVRDLRQKERSANEKIMVLDQIKKHAQDEYCSKIQELETELASSDDLRKKLERQVSYLQNENALVESKQKELKATINSLLQSGESFINAHEESFYKAKRLMEDRDRKLAILTEKIDSFATLFESIEKEALYVNRVVDDVQHLVSEKEEVVTSLRSKMDKVSTFEKLFIERIYELEDKLKNNEEEFCRKNRIISELEAQLEAATIRNNHRTQTQEIQKILSTKDLIISNLISEKKALQSDILTLSIILQKIQSNTTSLNWEQRSLTSEDHDGCDGVNTVVNSRIKDEVPKSSGKSPNRAWETDSPHLQECTSVGSSLQKSIIMDPTHKRQVNYFAVGLGGVSTSFICFVYTAVLKSGHLIEVFLFLATLVFEPSYVVSQSISVKDEKENEVVLLHPFDSVSSTTNAEIS